MRRDKIDVMLCRDKLNILMEVYYREVEKLRDSAIQEGGCARSSCKHVVQSVKAICATLYKIETAEVIKSVRGLQTLMADAHRVRFTCTVRHVPYMYICWRAEKLTTVFLLLEVFS